MFDFFISHSSNDKNSIVEEFVLSLKNRGYSVWYDKNEILAGDNIIEQVKEGLKQSYCIVLILTDNFVKSKWTFFEMGQFDCFENRSIIPIIHNISTENKNQILNIIGNRKYIDSEHSNKEEIITALLLSLAKTKQKNEQLFANDTLYTLQKRLASYETINADLLSIKLKEYLELVDNHRDFAISAAQKFVYNIICNLLEYQGYKSKNIPTDSKLLSEIVVQHNIGSINIQEYINFILELDDKYNSDNYIKIINHALENILIYYIHTRYPITPSYSNIEVVYPEELTYNDFVDMYEIDKKVMRDDLIADIKTTYDWYRYNNYTHIAVRDIQRKKIVGYFAALPVTEETYINIINGTFQDKDFTIDAIEQYNFPDFYKLYIAGVGIEPQYQNTGAFIKLYNALIDIIITLARDRDVFISEVIAEASTKQGEKFCKMVGMKKITHTDSETDVYGIITIPPQFRWNNHKGKELFKLCKEKFEEYREYFETPSEN